MNVSRFKGGMHGTVYTCLCCRKRTRETGSSESFVELCVDCYDEAGEENAHADGYHREQPSASCPDCKAQGE